MTNTTTKGATAPKQIDTATLDQVVGASTSATTARPPREWEKKSDPGIRNK